MKNIQVLHHVINKCRVEILNYKCDYVGIQYSTANGYYFIGEDLYITYDGGSTGKSLKEIRLILITLDNLTKEIKVNGEKFVPTIEILKENGKPGRSIERCSFDGYFIREYGYDYGKPNNESLQISETIKYPICSAINYEWLLKHHFDIHGLIKKGLAIDINTLEK